MSVQQERKCMACQTAEVMVWFSQVSGKGRVTRHAYCRECARKVAAVRNAPPPMPTPAQGPNESLLDVVTKTLEGKKADPSAVETPEAKKKRLNDDMKKAIAAEKYEEAAKIRDELASLEGKPVQARKPAIHGKPPQSGTKPT